MIKRIISKSILILINQGVNIITPLIVFPIIVKNYGLESLGLLGTLIAISIIVSTICLAGAESLGIINLEKSDNKKSEYINFVKPRIILFFSVTAISIWLQKITFDIPYQIILPIICTFYFTNPLWLYNAIDKLKFFVLCTSVIRIISVCLIYSLDLDFVNIVIILYVPSIILNILLHFLFYCSRRDESLVHLNFSIANLSKEFIFVRISLIQSLIANAPVLFVANYVSITDAAKYTVAMQLYRIMCVVTQSFSSATISSCTHKLMNESNIRKSIQSTFIFLLIIIITVSLFVFSTNKYFQFYFKVNIDIYILPIVILFFVGSLVNFLIINVAYPLQYGVLVEKSTGISTIAFFLISFLFAHYYSLSALDMIMFQIIYEVLTVLLLINYLRVQK